MNSLTILTILAAYGWGFFSGMFGKLSIRRRYGRKGGRRA